MPPMKRCEQTAGFILAGGASSRMGRDKALLEIGGVPLVVRTARLMEPRVASVTVVAPPGRYETLGLRLLADDFPAAGPLGGVLTALRASAAEWNFVVACDLPYLRAEFIEWLLTRATASSKDALVPESARGLEPLCGVYHARCRPILAATFAQGVRKLMDALAGLNIEPVPESEWRQWDLEGLLLQNMNTPEDYKEACRRLERRAAP
jgi:molybdopterin-guanine dinucleotide biosynthesis protein A